MTRHGTGYPNPRARYIFRLPKNDFATTPLIARPSIHNFDPLFTISSSISTTTHQPTRTHPPRHPLVSAVLLYSPHARSPEETSPPVPPPQSPLPYQCTPVFLRNPLIRLCGTLVNTIESCELGSRLPSWNGSFKVPDVAVNHACGKYPES